jgi:succinate dehydrogenase / fumarate reductase flavoprotein subunit
LLDAVATTMRDDLAVTDCSMIFDTEFGETPELGDIGRAAVSLHAAMGRAESRGPHARGDFPKKDDKNRLEHTISWLDDDG